MILYILASVAKIIVGLTMFMLTYRSINVFQDQFIGIVLLLVCVLLAVWGASFFVFYSLQKLFVKINNIDIATISYQQSFLIGLFCIANLGFLINGTRTWYIGLLFSTVTIFLEYSITNGYKRK